MKQSQTEAAPRLPIDILYKGQSLVNYDTIVSETYTGQKTIKTYDIINDTKDHITNIWFDAAYPHTITISDTKIKPGGRAALKVIMDGDQLWDKRHEMPNTLLDTIKIELSHVKGT